MAMKWQGGDGWTYVAVWLNSATWQRAYGPLSGDRELWTRSVNPAAKIVKVFVLDDAMPDGEHDEPSQAVLDGMVRARVGDAVSRAVQLDLQKLFGLPVGV